MFFSLSSLSFAFVFRYTFISSNNLGDLSHQMKTIFSEDGVKNKTQTFPVVVSDDVCLVYDWICTGLCTNRSNIIFGSKPFALVCRNPTWSLYDTYFIWWSPRWVQIIVFLHKCSRGIWRVSQWKSLTVLIRDTVELNWNRMTAKAGINLIFIWRRSNVICFTPLSTSSVLFLNQISLEIKPFGVWSD